MPRNTHGDFDQVIEIRDFFFEDQARGSFNQPPSDINSQPGEALEFSGRVRTEVRNVWFGDAAETFDAATGTWNTARRVAPFNGVVFAIEITGYMDITQVPVEMMGNPMIFPLLPGSQRLNLHLAITFLAPLAVEQLAIRSARDQNFSAQRYPCAVVVLPTTDYNIQVNMQMLRDSPFIKHMVDVVKYHKAGDPEVKVIQEMVNKLKLQVQTQLQSSLRETCDWKIDRPQRMSLVTATPDIGVTRMEVRTSFKSIRVFMQTSGEGGQSQIATRSQIRNASSSTEADVMAITVNGKSLLQSLRQSLTETFPKAKKVVDDNIGIGVITTPGQESNEEIQFIASEPCTVATDFSTSLGGQLCTLTYLQAGIDEASNLILWFFLHTVSMSIRIDIEIELALKFTAERAVRGAKQVLLLQPKKNWYRMGVRADFIPGIPSIIVEAIAEGMVSAALNQPLILEPRIIDMPQNVFMFVNSVELHQAGAPREMRTWPSQQIIDPGGGFGVGVITPPGEGSADDDSFGVGVITSPGLREARFRDHDLVIHLGSRAYPRLLNITCVQPDASDPMRRIDGVGGIFPVVGAPELATTNEGNAPWAMPIDDAIDWIAKGSLMRAGGVDVILGQQLQDCPPANPVPDRLPYLRTTADQANTNNLAAMAPCFSADGVIATQTTRYSNTYVHWRDVLPFGGRGDEGANAGVEVDESCIVTDVVLELITRDEQVLATHRFNEAPAVIGTSPSSAGASMNTSPIGTNSLAVSVHWWFDVYQVCRYRLRYTIEGLGC